MRNGRVARATAALVRGVRKLEPGGHGAGSWVGFACGAVFGGCLVLAGLATCERGAFAPPRQEVARNVSGLIADAPAESRQRVARATGLFAKMAVLVERHHVSEVLDSGTVSRMVDGALETLDPWSGFIGEDKARSLIGGGSGDRRLRMGVLVSDAGGVYRVEAVTPGGPAERAGIRPGDRVIRVGGRFVGDETPDRINAVVMAGLSGTAGAGVSLGVERAGSGEALSFVVRPEAIDPVSVFDLGVHDGVLHIYVRKFYPGMAADADRLISRAVARHDIEGVALDMRNNGGGLTDEAQALAELFLPNGSLLFESSGRKVGIARTTTGEAPEYPDLGLSVIVNGNSASASEIFTGAIQALDRGLVVGWPTMGKGTIQRVFPMEEGAVTITFAQYRDAGLRRIDGVGVMPNRRMEAPDPGIRPSRFDKDTARKVGIAAARRDDRP